MTDVSDTNRFAPPRVALADAGGPDGLVLAGRGMRLVAVLLDGLLVRAS